MKGSQLCECKCGGYAKPGRKFILGHNNKGIKGLGIGRIPWNKGLKGFSSGWLKGKKQTPEHIAKRVAKQIGSKRSESTKGKMRVSKKGEKNPFYNKHHIQETKEKISVKNKGRKQSDEERNRRSISQKIV